jgi:hypothetical protein
MMYEELAKRLREPCQYENCVLCQEAADAIEELQKQLQKSEADNVNLTGWLAEERANNCPHFIRNVHDRGDDSLCDKYKCEVNALPRWIPVGEQLPGEYVNVLVFLHSLDWNSIYYSIDHLTEEGQWWKASTSWKHEVTHWMPLPEPPKEDKL